MQSSKIRLSVSYVVLFTLIAKILGFAREMLLSYFFGTSGISDAYLISQNIPGTIFLFVGTGLSTCYIPVYYRIMNEGGKDEAYSFTSRIMGMVLFFSAIVVVLTCFFTPYVVKVFASGFEGETLRYAIIFTRIGILSLFFSAIIYVYSSFLQANNIFGLPAFSVIPYTLILMVAIILGAKNNILLLSIVSVIAAIGQVAVLSPKVHNLGYRFRLSARIDNKWIKTFFRLMIPVIIGVSVNEINALVDRTIASRIGIGTISALTYANSLIQLVQGGFVQPIVTVYYPTIAKGIVNHEGKEITIAIERIERLMFTVLAPLTAFFMAYSRQIVSVIYARGAFGVEAINMTSKSLLFYAISICFVGLREPISRLFYAYSDTKTPMINAAFGMVVNIVLNIVLSRYMGISGLALATSVSAIVTYGMLMIECWRKLPNGRIKVDIPEGFKVVVATGATLGLSLIMYNTLGNAVAEIFKLLIILIAGAILYLGLGYLFKNRSVKYMVEIVKSKLNKDKRV